MIVSTATGKYLGPSPQTLSIAKRAMKDALPHLKQMEIMQAHVRAVQPILNALRSIPLREIHNHIQLLNSILPSLDFSRFVEETEALSRAQSQFRFYREILSNASYRKEKIFCSRVENSPPRIFKGRKGIHKRKAVKLYSTTGEDTLKSSQRIPSIWRYIETFFIDIIPNGWKQRLRIVFFPQQIPDTRAIRALEGFSNLWINFISCLQITLWRLLPIGLLIWQLERVIQLLKEFSLFNNLIKFLY